MKKKYLHVEIMDGVLHIYASDEKFGGKIFTLNAMNKNCEVTNISCKTKDIHKVIPLKDFITAPSKSPALDL